MASPYAPRSAIRLLLAGWTKRVDRKVANLVAVISDDGGSTALLPPSRQEGRGWTLEGDLARASRLPCGRCRTCLSCSVGRWRRWSGGGLPHAHRVAERGSRARGHAGGGRTGGALAGECDPVDARGWRAGALAALPSFAADGNKKPGAPCWAAGLSGDLRPPGSLVAGAGFEPAAFRL